MKTQNRPVYEVFTTIADVDAGYPPFGQKTADRTAVAGIIATSGIPEHRLSVSETVWNGERWITEIVNGEEWNASDAVFPGHQPERWGVQ